MLLAGDPRPRSPSGPEVKGTSQWELPVIDSSETGHGPNDTRYKADGTFREGQGQGIFRLYSEETTGAITGYSWSNLPNSQYFDLVARPLVIGRLDAALILN